MSRPTGIEAAAQECFKAAFGKEPHDHTIGGFEAIISKHCIGKDDKLMTRKQWEDEVKAQCKEIAQRRTWPV